MGHNFTLNFCDMQRKPLSTLWTSKSPTEVKNSTHHPAKNNNENHHKTSLTTKWEISCTCIIEIVKNNEHRIINVNRKSDVCTGLRKIL